MAVCTVQPDGIPDTPVGQESIFADFTNVPVGDTPETQLEIHEFAEMSVDELMMTDGGFAISACAWIGIGLFAGGTILGIGWALCD